MPVHMNDHLLVLPECSAATEDASRSRDDMDIARQALAAIRSILKDVSPRERARVFHSIVDSEAAIGPNGIQLIANFVNDRLLLAKGASKAAEYWRYLAEVRTDPRHAALCVESANRWGVVAAHEHAEPGPPDPNNNA